MFSLLHDTSEPQDGQPNLFPLKCALSNASADPNCIGDLNHVLQFKHCSCVTLISVMGALLGLLRVGANSVTEAGRPPYPLHFLFAPACRIALASHSSVFAAEWKQRARNSAKACLAQVWCEVFGLFMAFIFLPT